MVLEGRSEELLVQTGYVLLTVSHILYVPNISFCLRQRNACPPCLLKVLRGAANNSLNHWLKKQAEKMFLQLFPSCAVSVR